MNNCYFIGRVTKDIELRATKNGTNVCSISLALLKKSKNEEPTFLNIIAFNMIALNCNSYVKKGYLIAIECYVKNNNWEDDNGNKHYDNQFIAKQVHFLSKSKNTSDATEESNTNNADLGLTEEDLPF